MPSVDERVVAMAFENQVFEQRIAKTMITLGKLDAAIKNIGSSNGLDNIEKSASKVTLQQPMSALEKLKARFGRAGGDAAQGMNEIERAGNKVQLEQPIRALNKVETETANVGRGAAIGFNEIEKASNRVSLSGVNNALNTVIGKFSVLQGAASVAFGNIASQAAMRGASFAKSFSFGPIQQGFEEYQTNLSSIQTIMANTEGQRISGLGATNKALNQLNHYSDKTIYNFSQMARNIGTFTAAGVDLKTSTASIKGIANLAALSGSNAQQASTAMYQLSQAIAAGKVGLQDWNSVVNAGMGGRKFQNSLIQTGVAMGTIEKGAVKIDKATGKATINGQSFRESIMAAPGKTSWLSSEVLTSSLSQFTGDMTDAQLAAKGFSTEQIKSIQATAKTAQKAATEVKTLPQVFDVAKEAIGSGWSQTFSAIFGDFKESKKTFTDLSTFINGIIGNSAKKRNEMLADWKKLGGRDVLIKGIKQAFQDLGAVLKPIRDAFRDIFPTKTGKDLFAMTKSFADLMKNLKPSAEVVDGLRRTFRGLFAVLHIGWSIAKGVIGVFADLLGLAGRGAGGFLNFTGSIGDLAVALDKALTEGGLLKSFFGGLTNILRIPLEIVQSLGSAFSSLFSADHTQEIGKAGDAVKGLGNKFAPLEEIIDRVKVAIGKAIHVVNKFFEPFSTLVSGIGHAFANIGTTIAESLKNVDLDTVFKGLNTAFLGGIFLAIKKFLGEGSMIVVKPLKQVGDALTGMTGVLKNMQQALKAGIILAIAAAVLALGEGVKILASIDPGKLTRAMTGVAIGLGELVGAIGILQAISKGKGTIGLPIIAASMVVLAGAIVILAGAMKIFATMSWDDLTKGLIGVGGALAGVGIGMKLIGPSITLAAPGILAVALAMNVLAVAMKIFGQMQWDEIAKGIIGIGASLTALAVGIETIGPSILLVGPGLIAAGFGLSVIAGALAVFGKMDLKTLIQGALGMSTALGLIGLALQTMPPGPLLAAQAAGLILAGIALTGIGGAIKLMGSMGLAQMAKGLVTLGAALFELAIGLDLMTSTIPGAAALLLAATALAVLTPVIAVLGTLSWGVILKGLVAIAGALAVLGLVGGVASPGIAALGIALTALGIAIVTIGAGVYLIAKALIMLGDASVQATGVLIAAVTAFIAVIPKMVIEFLKGILEIAKEIGVIAPQLVAAISKILDMVLQVIINSTPKLAQAIGTLIDGILLVVVRDSPKLIKAGITLILNLLKGIDQNIEQVVTRISSIITKFLNTLAAKAPDLTAAGARFLIAFLDGIAAHITDVTRSALKVVFNFLNGLASLPGRLVEVAGRAMVAFLNGLAKWIPKLAAAGAHMVVKTLDGISSRFDDIAKAATRFVVRFFNAFGSRENVRKMVNAGLKAAIHILQGISDGIRDDDNLRKVVDAAADVGRAIVEGLAKGLADIASMLAHKLTDPVKGAVDDIFSFVEAHSPSRLFMRLGSYIVAGMGIGLDGFADALSAGVTQPLAAMVHKNKDARAIGKYLGNEFRDGLTGGIVDKNEGKTQAQAQIAETFKGLREKLGEEQQKLRDRVKEDRTKLNDLLKENPAQIGKIQKAYRALGQDTMLLATATSASSRLMQSLQGQKKELSKLAAEYDLVTRQLDKAKEVFSQFDTLPDVDALVDDALQQASMTASERWDALRKAEADKEAKHRLDQVALYKQNLQKQIAATTQYMKTLQKLRDAGLDDQTYQKLLDMGTAGQEFASQLLSSGKGGIEQINKLDSQLASASSKLAEKAAKALVTAGDQAAQGLITGLQNRQSEIRKTMEDIASSMVKAIKKQLGIKSPSQIFAEIGMYSVRGLADGLSASSNLVRDAAESIGDDAADALTKSLAGISDRVQNSIDTDVTITPVLDLTEMQKDASKIQDLANVVPITAATSYGQATAISEETQATAAAQAEASGQPTIEVNLEQNNTSPKALDDVEIYRATRNQMSQVKSALGLVSQLNS